jgi:hypothetical protein
MYVYERERERGKREEEREGGRRMSIDRLVKLKFH